MKKLKVYEEDVLTLIYNIFAIMESETDNINMYLRKIKNGTQISQNDIFDVLENAIEICENYNKMLDNQLKQWYNLLVR